MSTKSVVIIFIAFLVIAGGVFFITRGGKYKSDDVFTNDTTKLQTIPETPTEIPVQKEQTQQPETLSACVRAGCNNELCVEPGTKVSTTCVALPEYSCLANYAVCERQNNGKCGWTHTETYQQCMIEVTGK